MGTFPQIFGELLHKKFLKSFNKKLRSEKFPIYLFNPGRGLDLILKIPKAKLHFWEGVSLTTVFGEQPLVLPVSLNNSLHLRDDAKHPESDTKKYF